MEMPGYDDMCLKDYFAFDSNLLNCLIAQIYVSKMIFLIIFGLKEQWDSEKNSGSK